MVGRPDGRTVGRWLVAVAGVLSASPSGWLAAQSRLWRPEERAVVSDFSYVQAVAASPFLVFAATTHGLTIYDRGSRSWRLPVTAIDGYPSAPVRCALADAVDNAVWLGTDDGWARYDVDLRQWERGLVAGGVASFVLDARDQASGIFVRAGGVGWGFLPRGALLPVAGRPLPPPGQRVQPLDPQAALNQAPMADAMRALILTDPRLRAHHFTAAARAPGQNELFFGTDGMGLVRVDATTAEWERLGFGLAAPRAGALALGPDGVWVAAVARLSERRGLTWVQADLSTDSVIEGPGTLGFGCVDGRRLLASGRSLWLACERGLVKIETGSYRTRVFDAGRGLPSENVLSLAPAPDGVWVGTTRGLAVVTNDDRVVRVGELAQPVLALLAVRESVWVGTTGGLGLLAPGSSEVAVPPGVAEEPALRAPVVALARVRDTIVAATTDQLAWRDPAGGRWTLVRARADWGAVGVLAGDAGGVWIGGAAGLGFWDLAHGSFHTLRVPDDLPAGVRDLAVDPAYLWVATDSGLVRLSRSAALGR